MTLSAQRARVYSTDSLFQPYQELPNQVARRRPDVARGEQVLLHAVLANALHDLAAEIAASVRYDRIADRLHARAAKKFQEGDVLGHRRLEKKAERAEAASRRAMVEADEDLYWFEREDAVYTFAFRNICNWMEVDADRLRSVVVAAVETRDLDRLRLLRRIAEELEARMRNAS